MKSFLVAISRWRTLADGPACRQDNFLLLRFIAATMVIYGHSHLFFGMGVLDIFQRSGWGTYSGTIAVDFFFTISGFLVTGSLLRQRNVISFILARTLRLLPAYALCLVFCAFVFGPMLSALPLHEYLQHPDTAAYVWSNLELQNLHWQLPGVFANNPPPQIVNASIWTLPAEASMYLWLAVLGLVGIFRLRWLASVALIVLSVYGFLHWPDVPMLIYHATYAQFAGLFALGSFCYLHRAWIPLGHPWMFALVLLSCFTHGSAVFPFSFALAEAYFCFWFAYCLPWYAFNRMGDYSYGIYLWGFPCQQFVMTFLNDPWPGKISLYAFPLALTIAVISWHGVEQPALRLKNWHRWRKHKAVRTKPAVASADTDNTDAV